jgi:hypothetical protein
MNERPDGQVNVNTGPRWSAWLLPATAIALVAAVALVLLAPRDDRSAATPQASPTASATAPTASPSTAATATATAAATSPTAASPTAVSSPGAGTSDRFGFAFRAEGVLPALVVRSETSPQALDRLERVVSAAVSPDGRQIAAWIADAQEVPRRLVTLTVGTGAPASTTVLELPATERGGGVAWSADGRGLHIGVQSATSVPGAGGGPTAAFWRSVDPGTHAVGELARRSDGRLYLPVAWVRGAGEFATAIETGEGGFASGYYLWRPGAPAQRSDMPGAPQHLMSAGSVQASADGRRVLGSARGSQAVNEHTVFVWPADAPERAVALRPREGDGLGVVAFRSGGDEIGVASGPMTVGAPGVMRLEIWTPAGQRRVVRDSGGLRSFRVDGSAAVTADNNIVDIATGRATPIAGAGPQDRVIFTVLLR